MTNDQIEAGKGIHVQYKPGKKYKIKGLHVVAHDSTDIHNPCAKCLFDNPDGICEIRCFDTTANGVSAFDVYFTAVCAKSTTPPALNGLPPLNIGIPMPEVKPARQERKVWVDEGFLCTEQKCSYKGVTCHNSISMHGKYGCFTTCGAFSIKDGCAICKRMHGDQIIGFLIPKPEDTNA